MSIESDSWLSESFGKCLWYPFTLIFKLKFHRYYWFGLFHHVFNQKFFLQILRFESYLFVLCFTLLIVTTFRNASKLDSTWYSELHCFVTTGLTSTRKLSIQTLIIAQVCSNCFDSASIEASYFWFCNICNKSSYFYFLSVIKFIFLCNYKLISSLQNLIGKPFAWSISLRWKSGNMSIKSESWWSNFSVWCF